MYSYRERNQYKYLLLLIVIYISIFPLASIGLHKPLIIGSLHIQAGIIIFPLSFILGDIIAEVYGYQITRQLLWCQIPGAIFYQCILYFIVHAPYPINWQYQAIYEWMLNDMVLVSVMVNVGAVIGFFCNAIIISRWKILVRGKHFWFRNICSTAFGELIQLTIGLTALVIIHMWPLTEILRILVTAYLWRLTFAAILSAPTAWLTDQLKKVEQIDAYNLGVDFNPFRLEVKQNIS